jgi:drug/metabolite transporter (DMT)-like permease
MVTFLMPIFGILWGGIFLGERMTPALGIGCLLVLLGIAITLFPIPARAGEPRPG